MRLISYALSLVLAGAVSAQTIAVHTNNFFDLNPDRDAFSALAGGIRIRLTVTDGTAPYDISAGIPAKLRIISRVDDYTNSILNTITNDGPGVIWWVIPALSAGSYRLQSDVVLPGDTFPIYDRYLTVTSAPSAASATVNVALTNDITVNATSTVSLTSITTNEITVNNYITNITQSTVYTSGVSSISFTGAVDGAITFTGSGVTQTGNVFNFSGGGGGGDVSINGVTTNSFSFVGQFPVSVSNIGGTFYFGQVGGGGTFIPANDSNQVFNFVGSVTQTFTVPSGVTQLYAYAWGAGGSGGNFVSGGAGGYSFGYFNVTNGEVLSVVIGEGGFISSTTTSTSVSTNTANPFPNGGRGVSKGTARAGAGGGSTALLRGTNFLIVAGGGGGAGGGNNSPGGGGGGTSGQDGFTSPAAGGGGTQSAGGAAGITTIALIYTNTSGGFYSAGDGGLTTNLLAIGAGGAGGGLYGGGGGVAGTGANSASGGGAGSGHINNAQGVLGTTVQAQNTSGSSGSAQAPPATDDPLYGSPTAVTWGRGGGTATAGSNGGMIIRWVQP